MRQVSSLVFLTAMAVLPLNACGFRSGQEDASTAKADIVVNPNGNKVQCTLPDGTTFCIEGHNSCTITYSGQVTGSCASPATPANPVTPTTPSSRGGLAYEPAFSVSFTSQSNGYIYGGTCSVGQCRCKDNSVSQNPYTSFNLTRPTTESDFWYYCRQNAVNACSQFCQ